MADMARDVDEPPPQVQDGGSLCGSTATSAIVIPTTYVTEVWTMVSVNVFALDGRWKVYLHR